MLGRRSSIRPTPDTVAVAQLGVAFLVVGLLLGQALLAMRSHERTVQITLEDFASFASERIAEELNSTFSTVLLSRIAAGKAAHDAWTAGEQDAEVERDPRLPAGSIPVHFTLDDGRVFERSGQLDETTRALILGDVARHAEQVYPRPAPYALLRASGSAAVVYRKEQYYGKTNIYGFVIRFDRFGPIYERLLRNVSVLPRSLSAQAEAEQLVSVVLSLPQTDDTLFVRRAPEARSVVTARSHAAKAGLMEVAVELDAEATRALVPGGNPNARLPLLIGLAVLTLGLLTMAVALTRRAGRLNELREVFVANASHDLRTPLAQIRMFSETLMLDRMTDAGERRRALGIIHQQATHLGDIVENILHAAERGGPRPSPEPTDLDALLADATAALAPAVHSRAATVEHSREGPATASIDPAIARRIVTNLVDNALKFGPSGQTVRVSVANSDEEVEVCVEDEGPGIPRRERTRVWERFERLDASPRGPGGTGLGLAVVRDLALRHGGHVRIVESERGGARVVVVLATGKSSS